MDKKYLLVGMAAILGVSLSFFACDNATNGAKGVPGAAGTIYLSGQHTTVGIQAAIDSGAPLVFAGVEQSNAGTVTIKAGRKVMLIGAEAYKTEADGILVVEDASSVAGKGSLVSNGARAVIIAPAEVSTKSNGGATAPIQDGSEKIKPAAIFAVKGPVTISSDATSKNNINVGELSNHTVYVIGDVTVSAATTGKVNATGKATFNTAVQTGLGGLTAGSVESSMAITMASDANINVAGELKTTVAAANVALTGTGTLTAGSLDLAGNLTVGTATVGAVKVNGTADIKGTLANGAAAAEFTFNGVTTVTGMFTPGAANTVIAGTGKVTFTAALGDTTTNNVVIKNTGGVTLTAANDLATNLKATKITIIGDGSTGVTIQKGAANIAVPANASIIVPTDGSIVAGGASDNVKITGATLTGGTTGTYRGDADGLTLGANTLIAVNGTGKVEIGGNGKLNFTDATSKISLLEGGSLVALTNGGDILDTSHANVKLSITNTGGGTKNYAKVTDASKVFTVEVASSAPVNPTNVVLGKVQWNIPITNVSVNSINGADATTAAAGTLKAGTGTTLTLVGTL